MSLWTPSGEHPVGDQPPRRAAPPPARGAEPAAKDRGPGGAGGSVGDEGAGGAGEAPGAEDAAATVDELRRELANAPAEVVVANHCYGLFELAAVYLSQQPPLLPQAQLAIDALGCLVDGLGEKLGDAHDPLRDALAQVRVAFVQVSAAVRAANGEAAD